VAQDTNSIGDTRPRPHAAAIDEAARSGCDVLYGDAWGQSSLFAYLLQRDTADREPRPMAVAGNLTHIFCAASTEEGA
jgi:hypothetical protein